MRSLLLVLVLLVPSAADAHVRTLDVEVEPKRDGWVRVTEVFSYDFGTTPGVYVERELARTSVDGADARLVRVLEVTDTASVSLPYARIENREAIRLHIGDDVRRDGGIHTIRIVYEVADAVEFTPVGEELRLDVVGDGWRVPVERLTVQLLAPLPEASDAECTTLLGNADTESCEVARTADRVAVRAADLAPSESLVLSVHAPVGTFRRSWAPLRLFYRLVDHAGYSSLMPLFLLLLLGALSRLTKPEDDELAERHSPPERLGPAEVGAVFGARVNATGFAATVLDLVVRGHLRFSRVESTGPLFALNRSDWELAPGERGEALRDYEVVALAALLGGEETRRLSELRETLPKQFREFRRHVYRTLRKRGRTFYTAPESVDERVRMASIAAALVGVVGLVFGQHAFGLSWLASSALIRAGRRFIPVRTAAGARARREVEGFRVFVTSATKADLIEHGAWSVEVFETTLPYAIAVGEGDAWADRYGEPYSDRSPDWTDAAHPLDELGAFITALRATVIGIESTLVDGEPRFTGRYSEGPFG